MVTRHNTIKAVIWVSISARLLLADDAACYFPNRDRAYDFIPCGDGAAVACCGPAQICLDNNYCMSIGQPFTLARGACTDQGWTSAACPSQCQDVRPNSGVSIILQKYENGVSTYCCNSLAVISGSDIPLCYENTSTFQLPDGQVIPGRIALENFTSISESQTSTATTTAAISSSATSDLGSTADPSSGTITPSSGTEGSVKCETRSHDLQIGVGVGVPLAAAVISAVAWAVFERRKRRTGEHPSVTPAELSGQYPHKPHGTDVPLQSPQSRYQSGTPSELGS